MAPQTTPTCQVCGGPLGCGVGGKPPIICLGHEAVPEMLEALKAVDAWWTEHMSDTTGPYGEYNAYPREPEFVALVLDALAKAEGREIGEGEG